MVREWEVRASKSTPDADQAAASPDEGQSHGDFAWLVKNLPGVLFRCAYDEHWTVHFVSDYVRELTGYPPDALTDNRERSFGSIVHDDDLLACTKIVRAMVERDLPWEIEFRIHHAGGAVRWVRSQGRAVRDAGGRVVSLNGAAFDVTEKKRMEQTEAHRAASVARQRRALVTIATTPFLARGDLSAAAAVITEAVTWATESSRVSVWMLDGTRERLELVDLYVAEQDTHEQVAVLSAQDAPSYFAALRTGRAIDAHEARTDPRTREFVSSYLEPLDIYSILDGAIRLHGEVVGVVCIEQTGGVRRWADHEIAFAGEVADQLLQVLMHREQRQAAAERERLQVQLFRAQKMEAIGRLAGGVAHDFNNLITAIAGYAGLLLEDLAPGDVRREDALEIAATTQRARELTHQLLAFSRREEIQIQAVDLSGVVANLERLLNRLIEEAYTIDLRLDAEVKVWGTPGLIEQVLTNLVVNARDAMPAGGELIVATGQVSLGRRKALELDGIAPGMYGWLRVEDEGVGIDAESQAKIFEPFFTTKEAGRGTGLGLSTVYGIARRCGGSVEVRSGLGEGTAFTVYFPVATGEELNPAPGPMAAATTTEDAIGAGRRIVVVEDERSVRELTTRVLTRAGFEVVSAEDGRVAMALMADMEQPPALVLTDMIMPVASGIDVVEWLRGHHPQVPVLLMSGYIDETSKRRAAGIPALQKPFTPAQLRRRVLDVLD